MWPSKNFSPGRFPETRLYFFGLIAKIIWPLIQVILPLMFHINPFVPNASFLWPLKTLENLKIFWYFQGVVKGCIGNKWVNEGNPVAIVQKGLTLFHQVPLTSLAFCHAASQKMLRPNHPYAWHNYWTAPQWNRSLAVLIKWKNYQGSTYHVI